MDPQEKQLFDDLKNQVDTMAQLVQRHNIVIETLDITPIKEAQLPPHFHKTDRISIRDLRDGFNVLTSTPTQVAEEGKCVLYTTGGAYRVAFKVDQGWRTAALS